MASSREGQAPSRQISDEGPVRIGIDYTAAVRQRAGIGRYTRNLIRTLAAMDQRNQYRLFVAGGWGNGDGLGPWPPNFRIRSFALSDRWLNIIWQRLRLPFPIQLVTGRLDLFHSPDFVLPPTGRTPTVLTVHDLSFLRVPECFVPGFAEYLGRAVSRAVRRAGWILADSENTKRDVIELMNADPARVTVVFPGVEARFQPVRSPEALGQVRERYNLPPSFVLGLGTLQPRKNLKALVGAFARLLAASNDIPEIRDVQLVLAGERGWMCEGIFAEVAGAGIEDRVCFTGFVEEADLPALYSLALVFAFPSWYEGFGLPVLEAMACGVPVVAADNSSLPEVVGEAGILVRASDIDSLAQALAKVLVGASLRSRLSDAGRERALRFTWEKAARQLLDVYMSRPWRSLDCTV